MTAFLRTFKMTEFCVYVVCGGSAAVHVWRSGDIFMELVLSFPFLGFRGWNSAPQACWTSSLLEQFTGRGSTYLLSHLKGPSAIPEWHALCFGFRAGRCQLYPVQSCMLLPQLGRRHTAALTLDVPQGGGGSLRRHFGDGP